MPFPAFLNGNTLPVTYKVDIRPHEHAYRAVHAAQQRRVHGTGVVVHKAHLWGRFRDGFEPESDERADMAPDSGQGDAEGREIVRIQRAFFPASGNGDDAAERGCALEEGEKVDGETEAGVEC